MAQKINLFWKRVSRIADDGLLINMIYEPNFGRIITHSLRRRFSFSAKGEAGRMVDEKVVDDG